MSPAEFNRNLVALRRIARKHGFEDQFIYDYNGFLDEFLPGRVGHNSGNELTREAALEGAKEIFTNLAIASQC